MIDAHARHLAHVLEATPNELARRAEELFERESGRSYPAPLVLCGAGRLGRIMLGGLRHVGADVLTFADNSRRLYGRRVDDCDVVSIEEAADRHGRDAVFVTSIYTARPLREQLAALGVPVVSSRAVFFQHPAEFLPHASVDWPSSIAEQTRDIVEGLSYWADDASRSEYVAQIAWHSLASTKVPLWLPPEQTYFPEGVVRLSDHEVFVDCGAFDGDTLRAFLSRKGDQFERLIAFEPDPTNFEALESYIAGLPLSTRERIDVRRVAVHSGPETLRFASADGAGSAVAVAGDVEVEADSLDNLLAGIAPTFVKMDIEGAEPNAIRGAAATFRAHPPTLAICLYHARDHLWLLPRAIRSVNPSYNIYLRRHSDECWETMAYAVPQ